MWEEINKQMFSNEAGGFEHSEGIWVILSDWLMKVITEKKKADAKTLHIQCSIDTEQK